MKKIPIYYQVQTDEDKSLNCFVIDSDAPTMSEVKVKDIVSNFPLNTTGTLYHFRFQAMCDKDKAWVDISNLNARAPVINNQIIIKALPIPKASSSKVFKKLLEQQHGLPSSSPRNSDRKVENSFIPNQNLQNPNVPSNNYNNVTKPQPQVQQHVFQTPNLYGEEDGFKKAGPTINSTNRPSNQTYNNTPTNNVSNHPDLYPGNAPSQQSSQSYNNTPTNNVSNYPDLYPVDAPSQKNSNMNNIASEMGNVSFNNVNFTGQQPSQNLSHAEWTKVKEQQLQDQQDRVIADLRNRNAREDEENDEQIRLQDELEPRILKWSHKEKIRNNLRTLLYTLPDIVWQNSGWDAVDFSSLMDVNTIKRTYKIAMVKLHEDKLNKLETVDSKTRYLSKRVCAELTEAYKDFNAKEAKQTK